MSKHVGADTEKNLNKMWDSASAAEKRFFQEKAATFLKAKKDENSNADAAVPEEEETKINDNIKTPANNINDGSESSTASDSTSVIGPVPTPKRKVGRPSLNKTTVSVKFSRKCNFVKLHCLPLEVLKLTFFK